MFVNVVAYFLFLDLLRLRGMVGLACCFFLRFPESNFFSIDCLDHGLLLQLFYEQPKERNGMESFEGETDYLLERLF